MKTQLTVIEKEISPIAVSAISLEIVDDTTLKQGVSLLSILNKYLDALVEDREKLTKPINESLKQIRAKYKQPSDALESLIASLRTKMTLYATEQAKALETAQNKIASKVSTGYLRPETAISKLEALPVTEKEQSTPEGLVQFADVKCFEVVSIKDLPIEYHTADEVAIRKEMKAGKELSGVRYWTEKQPRNYR
jgi:hypothetical protein